MSNHIITSSPLTHSCYHCHTPVLPNVSYEDTIGEEVRYFCCSGCLAIAMTIHAQGLDIFYTRRLQASPKPLATIVGDQIPEQLLAYDDPLLLGQYTRPVLGTDHLESTLRLEKIRCAACVWLCEQHLLRLPGVHAIQIHYVTQRARVIFDPKITSLSRLLFEIDRIGYEAWPFEPSLSMEKSKKERRQLLTRLGIALLGMMQVMMYAWPSYVGSRDITSEFHLLLSWTSWLLTVPVILYSAAPIFKSAWHSIGMFTKSHQLNMDVPIALALGLSFVVGTVNTMTQFGPSYFDSITMFVAFILVARYVELLARQDAQSGAEALAKQLPATCERYVNYSHSSEIHVAPVVNCRIGDVIRVGSGQLIPMDAQVLQSESSVDESLLTGESRPIEKNIGDTVYAGTYNIVNPLHLQVTALGQSTRIAGIASLLDQALSAKPVLFSKTQTWSGYFIVILMLAAIFSSAIWLFIEPSRAWTVLMAVLVASCPCALSLAIPTALATSQGTATKLGLLIVRGHVMESLSKASDIVIDKTGTITLGEPELLMIRHLRPDLTEEQVLSIVGALEMGQTHPLALAILRAVKMRNITPMSLSQPVQNHLGYGLSSGHYRLGASSWVGVEPVEMEGQHVQVHLGDKLGLMASLIFLDQVRPGLDVFLKTVQERNIRVHLISGDHPQTVAWWANHVGITTYQGACTPQHKCQYVQTLQQAGRVVLAIGDGVNDAPLLASADVSIAVGVGAPLAIAGADAILTALSLAPLSNILKLADRTQSIITMNLTWALIYNVGMIPVAMLGWINPWIAGVGMSLSSLLVTLNAWRLRKA